MDQGEVRGGMLSVVMASTHQSLLVAAAVVVLFIWLDALRHLAMSHTAYFSWYRTLPELDKPGVTFGFRGLVRLRDIVDVPVATAPEAMAVRYRRNMILFLVEGGTGAMICACLALFG